MKYKTRDVLNQNGISPQTLKNWRDAQLIRIEDNDFLTEAELAEIRVIKALTSSGDTLEEVRTLLNDSWNYRHSGWTMRNKEFLICLTSNNDAVLESFMLKMVTTYALPDLITRFVIPMTRFLQAKGNQELNLKYQHALKKISAHYAPGLQYKGPRGRANPVQAKEYQSH